MISYFNYTCYAKAFFVLLYLTSSLFSQEEQKKENSASIKNIQGRAQYKPAGETKWQPLTSETQVKNGDLIRTGLRSGTSLAVGGDKIQLNQSTVLRIKDINQNKRLRVQAGKVRVQSGNDLYTIETSKAKLTMEPRSDAVVDSGLAQSSAHVIKGKGQFNNIFEIGEPVILTDDQSSSTFRTEQPSSPKFIKERVYEDWNIPVPLRSNHPDFSEFKANDPEIAPITNLSSTNNLPTNTTLSNIEITNAAVTNLQATNTAATNTEKKERPKRPPWKRPEIDFKFKSGISMNYFQSDKEDGTAYQANFFGRAIGNGDANHWIRFAWIPEFDWGPYKFAFFLPAYIGFRQEWYNPRKWYNFTDWDGFYPGADSMNTFRDVVDKIYYIEFQIWLTKTRLGILDPVTYGSGFLINDYQNGLGFPWERRFGAMFEYDDKWLGVYFHYFLGDVFYNDITGYRITWNPLRTILLTDNFWAKNWQIGFSHVIENRPMDLTGETHNVMGYHFDTRQKLLDKEKSMMDVYLNLAWLVGRHPNLPGKKKVLGPGYSLGVGGNFGFLHWKTEGFYNSRGYVPEYFNETHYYRDDPDNIRDAFNENFFILERKSNMGYLAFIGLIFGKYGGITAEFKDFYRFGGGRLYNKLHLRAYMTDELLKIFYFDFYYIQENIDADYFSPYVFLNEEAQIGGSAHLKLGKGPFEIVARLQSQNGELRWEIGFDMLNQSKSKLDKANKVSNAADAAGNN